MTKAEVLDEPYPWERTEPYIPPMSASLVVVPGTAINRFDFRSEDSDLPVSGLSIGTLTLHTGLTDIEALEVIDRLSEALRELRNDIDRRLTIAAHGPLPTADDVRGILA